MILRFKGFKMKSIPVGKYVAYKKVDLPNRQWVDKIIEKAPVWCSVDLRDGNQALITPMDLNQKLKLFNLLVKIGFKNIEVGFPSASKTEFNFLRKLIDDNLIPDDVTVQVLVQAREHLIEKTFEALKGAKKAIVHLYNSTSIAQRKIVFKKEKSEIIDLALNGVGFVKKFAEKSDTKIMLEYSPESFTGTELEFARDICNAVIEKWGVSDTRKIIINLPATVEMATPNIYADQIEWIGRELKNRENVLISLHSHNDRGTAVASTELGLLAGADRVEGTLLGNGERTGNVDILTLALNMTTQGINSNLDFTEIDEVKEVIEDVTKIDTHIRHPYIGELVYTAFSGSHQDAINKGLAYQNMKDDEFWEVPYLPIDPNDVGRTYEDIIRINSQSGKGGVAYILENRFGYHIPKAMHPEIGKLIQKKSDISEKELSTDEVFQEFSNTYLTAENKIIEFINFHRIQESDIVQCKLDFKYLDKDYSITESGNGILDACKKSICSIFPKKFEIISFFEHSKGSGSDAVAVAYIQVRVESYETFFGIGIDTDTTQASIKAIFSVLNRVF
jgi:2-isopropylmalate synthase